MNSKCLFGGALFAAGLSAHAGAQQFVDVDNNPYVSGYTRAVAYDYFVPPYVDIDGPNTAYFPASPFGLSSNASIAGSGASASITNTVVSASAYADDADSFAYGAAYLAFTVDVDAPGVADWDFTDQEGAAGTTFSLIAFGENGQIPLLEVNSSTAGTQVFPLTAGTQYFVFIIADASGPGTSFASFEVVPSPGGAAALALMGGLLATRRRR